ncbi:MAG TPA: VOC family protein [Gemmatimonadaceae bacterium]
MGVTTNDLFGGGGRAEPATPGSYGEPPSGFRLPSASRLGPVRLAVTDLGRSVTWYQQALGFRAMRREAESAVLAAQDDERPVIELHQPQGVRAAAGRGRLGLYHFAILLPDRVSLGRFVRHMSERRVRLGAGDHLVSEAFYLHDPDHLGIEVYADRPRSTWRRIGRELMMATDPVDTASLLEASGETPWSGMPAGTVIGHVHLHVRELDAAAAFYGEALGFDRMVWSYPGALFFAAGGYHHHLGTNTWAGPTARPPDETEARLLEWTIEVPDGASVSAVAASVEAAGYAVERENGAVRMRDPWGTALRVQAEETRPGR